VIINFGDLTIQEAQVVLAGLKKLPMEVVESLHNKLLAIDRKSTRLNSSH
jgi:hypothetical protein